jgi:hypothetical protein
MNAEIELLAKFLPLDVPALRRKMTGSVLTDPLPEIALRDLGSEVNAILNSIKTHDSKASKRAGAGCLNSFSASISGASAGVRLPSGGAAA